MHELHGRSGAQDRQRSPLDIEIVDLRSDAAESGQAREPLARSTTRASVVAGVTLLALGAILGTIFASSDGTAGREPVEEALAPRSEQLSPETTPTPGAATASPPLSDAAVDTSTLPTRPDRVLDARITPLPGIGELAGNITLVPGLDVSIRARLEPSGTITLEVPERESLEQSVPAVQPFLGVPLAAVADGLLFAPSEVALGAVAHWRPGIGISLPIPDEVYDTSYLAASGDLGVFLSAGEVVVRDLARAVDVLRVDSDVGGSPVVQACLDQDGTAVALVSRSGRSMIIDLQTGRRTLEFTTGTTLHGVAWTAPGQLAYLVDEPGAQHTVRAADVTSGASHDIARLERGANWKLTTEGSGC